MMREYLRQDQPGASADRAKKATARRTQGSRSSSSPDRPGRSNEGWQDLALLLTLFALIAFLARRHRLPQSGGEKGKFPFFPLMGREGEGREFTKGERKRMEKKEIKKGKKKLMHSTSL